MNQRRHQELEDVLGLTGAMLAHAREGAWDQVTEIERQRRTTLNALFDPPPTADEASGLARGIRQILDVDREIGLLCTSARDAMGAQLSQLRRGVRAQAVYQAHRQDPGG